MRWKSSEQISVHCRSKINGGGGSELDIEDDPNFFKQINEPIWMYSENSKVLDKIKSKLIN